MLYLPFLKQRTARYANCSYVRNVWYYNFQLKRCKVLFKMYYHILNSKNSTIILYIINQIYLNTYSSLIYTLLKKHANFRWSVGEKPFPKLIPKISPKPKKIITIYGILRTSKIYIKKPSESPFLGISEGLNHLLKKFALFHLLCKLS